MRLIIQVLSAILLVVQVSQATAAANPITVDVTVTEVAARIGTGHCYKTDAITNPGSTTADYVAFVGTELDLTKIHTSQPTGIAPTSWFRIKEGQDASIIEEMTEEDKAQVTGTSPKTSTGKIKGVKVGEITLEAVVTFSGVNDIDEVTIAFIELNEFTATAEIGNELSDEDDSYDYPDPDMVYCIENKEGQAKVSYEITFDPDSWSSSCELKAHVLWKISEDANSGWSPQSGDMVWNMADPSSTWSAPAGSPDRKAYVTCYYDRDDSGALTTSGDEWPRRLQLVAVNMELITPDKSPVSEPNGSGDGQNEYTYNDATVGEFTMNLKAKVDPLEAKDYVKEDCTFDVPDITGSTKTWAGANPGGKASVDGDFLVASVTFKTLPATNDQFGQKNAKLKYDDSIVDDNDFEVFFNKTATNGKVATELGKPNWFAYWKQGAVCGIPNDTLYASGAGWGSTNGTTITLKDGAPTQNWETTHPAVTIGGVTYPEVKTGATGKGIKSVAETITHEKRHMSLKAALVTDSEPDRIDDGMEASADGITTHVGTKNTYNYQWKSVTDPGPYAAYGDNEIRCLKVEANPEPYFTAKDWANPGCNSKNPYGP